MYSKNPNEKPFSGSQNGPFQEMFLFKGKSSLSRVFGNVGPAGQIRQVFIRFPDMTGHHVRFIYEPNAFLILSDAILRRWLQESP